MSTTVILLIVGTAGYVAFVAFVLALLTVSRRSSEVAEQHARSFASHTEPFPCRDRGGGDAEFTAGDVEFLERLEQRAARAFEDVALRTQRNAGW